MGEAERSHGFYCRLPILLSQAERAGLVRDVRSARQVDLELMPICPQTEHRIQERADAAIHEESGTTGGTERIDARIGQGGVQKAANSGQRIIHAYADAGTKRPGFQNRCGTVGGVEFAHLHHFPFNSSRIQ
jgi:hypothetical protein